MKTMQRSVERELSAPPSTSVRRPWWIVAVVAVVALLAGLVIGRWTAPSEGTPEVVVPGGTELTDRQQQMIDASERYLVAYQTNDADAIVAAFTPQGEKYVVGDGTYRVDDGTLRAFVETNDYTGMEIVEPMTVHENDVAVVVAFGGFEFLNVLVFTESGEVLITDHLTFGP